MKFRNRFGVETTVISQPIPERWETSGSTTYLGYGGDESKPMAIHKIEETSTGGTRKMAVSNPLGWDGDINNAPEVK